MLSYKNIDIYIEDKEPKLTEFIDSFFDFKSLLGSIFLTIKGLKKYPNNKKGLLEAILMTTEYNNDWQKYKRFGFKNDIFKMYYDDFFIGFNDNDIKRSIAIIIGRYLEEGLENNG